MDEIKLKPCPFCGGEAHLNKVGSLYFVICAAAAGDCSVNPWVGRYDNKAEAINAWNRRVKAVEAWNRRAEHE